MKKEETEIIIKKLKEAYPDAKCSLNFETPFQMLFAVVLSAQCTDERVNKVTPEIFKRYPEAKDIANLSEAELETLIKSCGFYKTKSKNLKRTAEILVKDYNGKVPQSIEELIKLPGVGRKCANVIMLEAFNNPQGIAVDTHCKRVSNRVGFSNKSQPEKIEEELLKIIPKKYYKDVNHLFIWHGRKVCTAQNPKCDKCPIKEYCAMRKKE